MNATIEVHWGRIEGGRIMHAWRIRPTLKFDPHPRKGETFCGRSAWATPSGWYRPNKRCSKCERLAQADEVLSAIRNSLEFTLACVQCDAGQGISSPDEAWMNGWRQIEVDEDGLGWNYLGVCPHCAPGYLGPEKD